jgi:hypothetical protein
MPPASWFALADPTARASVDLAWRATGASHFARAVIDLGIRARDQGELVDTADGA